MQLAIRKTGFVPGKLLLFIFLIIIGLVIIGFNQFHEHAVHLQVPVVKTDHLVVYDPKGEIPFEILSSFSNEFNIDVDLISENDHRKQNGSSLHFDVAILNNSTIPGMVKDGYLADIHFANIPNFKYISPDFRDLSYDPGNRHSIPFNWGTTGLIVRNDQLSTPLSSWKDLWNPEYAQKIVIRTDNPQDFIGLTLKSLGYSINTNDAAELEHALEQMLILKSNIILVDSQEDAIRKIINGDAAILIGNGEDLHIIQQSESMVQYIFPEEGTMLWGENMVVSARSENSEVAEAFINYLLRPEISAIIIREKYIATPNAIALSQIGGDILRNPAIFPQDQDLTNSEVFLPPIEESSSKYKTIWEHFINENNYL